MNKSRRDDSDAPRSQSLDKLDNFWINLNEATAMRPEAKAQIYSVNKNLPAYQQIKSLECDASLINSKELAEKKRKVAKSPKSKLQVKSRVCLLIVW